MTTSFRRLMRPALAIVILAGALAAALVPATRTASAAVPFHLRLVKSEPSKGDTVAAPKVVRLWFSEPATLAVTSIKLVGPGHRAITLGKPAFAGSAKLPVEAAVTGALAAGSYTVSYKTASKDMHPITGNFTFVVR